MKHFLPSYRLLALPLALLAAPSLSVVAQTPERRTSIGLNVSGLQYQGNFGSDYWKFDNNQYAPGLAINQYLTRGLDLNAQVFVGELTGQHNANTRFTTTLVNANLGFKIKLNNGWALKETAFFQPYLLAGSGWTYASRTGFADGQRTDQDKGYIDVMGGAGINFRLGGGVGLFVQSAQHLPMYANLDGVPERGDVPRWADRFLQHTAGLTFNLGQADDGDEDEVPDSQDKCPDTPLGVEVDDNGCPLDDDADGVPNYQDQCPSEVGKLNLQGCPDKDSDSVPDGDDACPDTPGTEELNGCPDTDKDGVTDAEDRCPNTPFGLAVDANGCSAATPADATADSDGDGVPNGTDRCPTSAGPASNRGCPEVKTETRQRLREATKFIGFELNRATLLPTSYPTLDALAQMLREYPDYSLSIAGHTDSKGPAAFNLRLSRERAAAARSYLVGKGIAENRVELRGYGSRQPIADNATEAGRARNRRVEFDLYLTGDPNAAEVKYGAEPSATDAAAPAKPTKAAPVKKAPAKKTPAKKAPTSKALGANKVKPATSAFNARSIKAARPKSAPVKSGSAKAPASKN